MIHGIRTEIDHARESLARCEKDPEGHHEDEIEDLTEEIESLERRLRKFERISREKKGITYGYIDTVISVDHNRLLVDHYVRGIPWTKITIPGSEYLSDRRIFQLANEAIDMIEDDPAYTTL